MYKPKEGQREAPHLFGVLIMLEAKTLHVMLTEDPAIFFFPIKPFSEINREFNCEKLAL